MLQKSACLLTAILMGLALTTSAYAQPGAAASQPGKAVYEKACASCHDHPGVTRAPSLDALKGVRYGTIHFALTEGKMQAQGSPLTVAERASVIDYLVGRNVTDDSWVAKMMCAPDRRTVHLDAAATVASFGFDRHNHRHLSRQQARL